MKLPVAWLALTALFLTLAAIPAMAGNLCDPGNLYCNGPGNWDTDAWYLSPGNVVSDTFTLAANSTVTGFNFGAWVSPGNMPKTVDWSITSLENGGNVYGSGTANITNWEFVSLNAFGYDVGYADVTGLNVGLGAGTYWLNLTNALDSMGNVYYWDENSGVGCQGTGCPSQASQNSVGTIASESFEIIGSSGTIPEPSSIVLFGSGILGLAGILRRKRF